MKKAIVMAGLAALLSLPASAEAQSHAQQHIGFDQVLFEDDPYLTVGVRVFTGHYRDEPATVMELVDISSTNEGTFVLYDLDNDDGIDAAVLASPDGVIKDFSYEHGLTTTYPDDTKESFPVNRYILHRLDNAGTLWHVMLEQIDMVAPH